MGSIPSKPTMFPQMQLSSPRTPLQAPPKPPVTPPNPTVMPTDPLRPHQSPPCPPNIPSNPSPHPPQTPPPASKPHHEPSPNPTPPVWVSRAPPTHTHRDEDNIVREISGPGPIRGQAGGSDGTPTGQESSGKTLPCPPSAIPPSCSSRFRLNLFRQIMPDILPGRTDQPPVNVQPNHPGGSPTFGDAEGEVSHVAPHVQYLLPRKPLRAHGSQPPVLAVGVPVTIIFAIIAVLEFLNLAALTLLLGNFSRGFGFFRRGTGSFQFTASPSTFPMAAGGGAGGGAWRRGGGGSGGREDMRAGGLIGGSSGDGGGSSLLTAVTVAAASSFGGGS